MSPPAPIPSACKRPPSAPPSTPSHPASATSSTFTPTFHRFLVPFKARPFEELSTRAVSPFTSPVSPATPGLYLKSVLCQHTWLHLPLLLLPQGSLSLASQPLPLLVFCLPTSGLLPLYHRASTWGFLRTGLSFRPYLHTLLLSSHWCLKLKL